MHNHSCKTDNFLMLQSHWFLLLYFDIYLLLLDMLPSSTSPYNPSYLPALLLTVLLLFV